jgi:hypothetical protein
MGVRPNRQRLLCSFGQKGLLAGASHITSVLASMQFGLLRTMINLFDSPAAKLFSRGKRPRCE